MSKEMNIIYHEGIEIQHHIGYKFLKFILEDDVNEIIEFVRDSIERLL
jgi:hypothetical protein